jgi:hypothetical protein
MRTSFALAALCSAFVLGGCTYLTGTSAHPTTGPQASAMCGEVTKVTSLVVHRVPINAERFGFPATVRVTSASSAQSVARAICSLSKAPGGVRSCPNEYGPTYHLTFFDKGRVLSVDLAQPTGCASVVEGSSTAHPKVLTPSGPFWKALGSAVGVRGATQLTFTGELV